MANRALEIIIGAKDEASSVFDSLKSKLGAIGLAIAGYFGISAFAGAVKGAADLEAKLSEVQAVSGATKDEMVLLRKAAEEAGATTKFTATEGADALGNLARAGLSAKDAIAALPAVLQLAQAGGIDLAQASEYVSKTVMGLGLSFADAGRVADVLAKGANASNTSVTGLAQALSYAAPLANTLGLSLETTVAIIGKFADAGIDASRAGTALNAIMAQFSDPASKFRTELASAGITTTNFEKALRELAAAGPAGSKAINAVGTEAGPALRALLNQGIGALDDLKGKLDNAKGSAAETAAVMQDNLTGSFKTLGSAWDTVKNALGTPVLPVLKDGVDKLAKSFQDAVGSGLIAKFGDSIATAFQAGIKWAEGFAASFDFTKLAVDLRGFADRAGEVFTQIGNYARNAGNIVQTVYGVMSAGINAVMVVVYGLGEAFAGVASNIQSGVALIMDGLAKVTFGGVSASFKQAADDIRLSAEATWAASEAFAAKGQAAFVAMGAAAEIARKGWIGLTTDTQAAATAAQASAPAFDAAAKAVESIAPAADTAKAATKATAQSAKEDADAIAAAFSAMGIKTKAELETAASTSKTQFDLIKTSGQATADGLQAAFKKYAEDAIAANNGVATETLKTQAAMQGLQITVDATGKAMVDAASAATPALQRWADMLKNVGDATAGMTQQQKDNAKATADLQVASESLRPALTDENTEKINGIKSSLESAQARYDEAKASGDEKGAAEALVEVKKLELELATALAEAKRAEADAAKASAAAKHAEADAAIETAKAIQAEIAASKTVTAQMKAMAAEANVNAVAKAGAAKQADAHAQSLDAEAKGLEAGVKIAGKALAAAETAYQNVGSAANAASGSVQGMLLTMREYQDLQAFRGQLDRATEALNTFGGTAKEMRWAAELANSSVKGLGDNELNPLRAALDAAISRMQVLNQEASSTLASISDELDQLNGNFDDIEKRAYETRKAKIQELIDTAKAEGNNSAQTDAETAMLKLDDIYNKYKIPEAKKKEADAAQKEKEAKAPVIPGTGSNTASTATPADIAAAAHAAGMAYSSSTTMEQVNQVVAMNQKMTRTTAPNTTYTVNVTINGQNTPVKVASEADAQALIAALKRAQTTA